MNGSGGEPERAAEEVHGAGVVLLFCCSSSCCYVVGGSVVTLLTVRGCWGAMN